MVTTIEIASTATGVNNVVEALYLRFGQQRFVEQKTVDRIPTLWVSRDDHLAVLTFLKREIEGPFPLLLDLTATDERLRINRQGLPASAFTVLYHLLSFERNSDVRVKVALQESEPRLKTIVGLWPMANWYEREVWDMFGIEFEGHPNLRRILLPPTWNGHPLRKDHPARATEMEPYSLSEEKLNYEQEALRFVPEEWGMKRHGENSDFMFLNLGPNHPSVHGVFRIALQLDGEEIVDAVPEC
jgi:NADH-quinone oxidoreductase subunit C/D